ncbi:GNAT family N-acetyltransferase [Streptomyces sp. P9(2023)]|uniref:GNAT family N-acetyltransferase n=1 Tax=Streptomyces sp. P9(2023) TaxID=3064394 RepID=UPI0028F42D0D|nr:GNAT family N-acetyltransferase [Streptomyces sp. P9(2023)]MDT9692517.1 GNAT family N-acetyltransferase [Streptomyces sp. P9(2023)]
MPELQLLRADHAPALLSFERENRAYFAAHVPDRGDAYFTEFTARHQALLDEQETGAILMHVLVGDGGEILGRFNLIDVADGGAELGYRVAEKATGRGVASAGVREVCRLAVEEYGLSRLTAVTTIDNTGSRIVLDRLGFGAVGSVTLDGQPGVAYEVDLARH